MTRVFSPLLLALLVAGSCGEGIATSDQEAGRVLRSAIDETMSSGSFRAVAIVPGLPNDYVIEFESKDRYRGVALAPSGDIVGEAVFFDGVSYQLDPLTPGNYLITSDLPPDPYPGDLWVLEVIRRSALVEGTATAIRFEATGKEGVKMSGSVILTEDGRLESVSITMEPAEPSNPTEIDFTYEPVVIAVPDQG